MARKATAITVMIDSMMMVMTSATPRCERAATATGAAPVAQNGILLYRRVTLGWALELPKRPDGRAVCGLPIRDTAECHSALQAGSRPLLAAFLIRPNCGGM